MDARHSRHAVGADRLVRPHGRIDPAALEEVRDDAADLGREVLIRLEHERRGLVPPHRGRTRGDRRHAVVVGQAVDPEQPRLDPVVALCDVVTVDDRVDERLHGLVRGLVGEVASGEPVRIVA
jgi:hypothetical protein